MKFTGKVFVLLASLLFVVSCQNNNRKQQENLENDYVHLKPDSVLSPKELELKHTLGDIIIEYVVIENNQFVFKLSKKEFLKKGVPEKYYNLVLQNIKDNNKYLDSLLDSLKIDNIDSLLENTKNQYKNLRQNSGNVGL
ncbi:MAG: hypothetical protein PHP30_09580 [Bacteroidales bacterium]|nr:hypothetical protein [Bacteroidales bacterium]MDD2426194.1 hypothetical protein [Bacteroidales bacterium]MDD3990327.1 hypothetical protein [Bacteroidales bacterium]